jgi:hypothetical protein
MTNANNTNNIDWNAINASAIHLNDTYVKRVGTPPPPEPDPLPARFNPSESTLLLFKDFLFLVIFGIVILAIARTVDPPKLEGMVTRPGFDFAAFTFGAEIFLLFGFAWALIDAPCRLWAGHSAGAQAREREWPGWRAYILWPVLDALQFLTTLGISGWPVALIWQMRLLALAYVIFLVAEFVAMSTACGREPPSDSCSIIPGVRAFAREPRIDILSAMWFPSSPLKRRPEAAPM